MPHARRFRRFLPAIVAVLAAETTRASAWAAAAVDPTLVDRGISLWELLSAGGATMAFLGLLSVAALASIFYHFKFVTPAKLTPPDFIENLLSLLEHGQIDKAASLCRSQPNLISAIALKGIQKIPSGKAVVEEALQYEGKARIEKLWQNLTYLGDMAVIAPMLGLLGTVLGMIDAFNYQAFKAGAIQPVMLAQGLAKAMITTATGLIIAVPILVFYAYFRGRIGTITTTAERASSEILHNIQR